MNWRCAQTCMLESYRMLLPSVSIDTNMCEVSAADTLPIRELVSCPRGSPHSSSSYSKVPFTPVASSPTSSTLCSSIFTGSVEFRLPLWPSPGEQVGSDDESSSIAGMADSEKEQVSCSAAFWLSCSLGLRIGEMKWGEIRERTLTRVLDLVTCWGSL